MADNSKPLTLEESIQEEYKPATLEEVATPVDTNLQEKLEQILHNLYARLSENEISCQEYSHLVFDQLQEQGIFDEKLDFNTLDYSNRHDLRYMSDKFIDKLSLKKATGLREDYYFLESVPISQKARNDISAFGNLKADLEAYLKQEIGEKPILMDEFKGLIMEYTLSKLPRDIKGSRYPNIFSMLVGEYEYKFNVISDQKKGYIGDYPITNIDDTLDSIELK